MLKNILVIFISFLSVSSLSNGDIELHYPNMVIEGVETNLSVYSTEKLPEELELNGEIIPIEYADGEAYISVAVSESSLSSKSASIKEVNKGAMIPLWMSILPPLLAIIMALVFKEVIFSLVSGIFLGGAIMGAYAEGVTGIFTGFFKIIDTYILGALNDSGHLSVIVFSTIIGGIVALISKNGGMKGIVNSIVRFANTARNGQLATWFLGIAIFFDDYANTLVVGNTMRAITDKLKVSREKLSYIVDSTAAPVSAIAFVTTWIGAELGYIGKGLENINADGEVISEGVYSIFLNSLAYSFYPILTLFFIFYLVYRGKDYGPMLKAERRARGGEVVNEDDNSGDLTELEDVAPLEGIRYRAFNAVIPVAIIVFGTLFGLVVTGFDTLSTELSVAGIQVEGWSDIWSKLGVYDPNIDSFTRRLGTLIGAADSYAALLWSSLASLAVAMLLTILQKIMGLKDTVETTITGFKTMVPALMILILAWALAMVTDEMHTADYITGILQQGSIPYWTIPAITFVLSGFVAFSTGSSWSTMALVYPLILPAAWSVCMDAGFDAEASMAIFYNTVSAVLAGSVLGDHCSPISDTTILSSLASGCNHIDHVRTQIPYALTVGSISVLLGTILSALGVPTIICFLIGIGAVVTVVELVGKKVE